jgi:Ca2+-binding EF-hand superfamily protein
LAEKSLHNNSVSVFYSSNEGHKSLDLIIRNDKDLKTVENVLKSLFVQIKQNKEKLTIDDLFVQEMWKRADTDGDNKLNESEVMTLISSMNINMHRSSVHRLFISYDEDHNQTLDLSEFKHLIEKLGERYYSIIS